ncbi:tRNA (adenosine(37)-N6)-threonylcarbamoyltransferase complex transferase subunit TsaD [Patescibacteria group bacterium]|nr:tRNA (adenosine(37)-N6)-threonylcarbamoyltransferase complex transferase subunit TsaD [Patescibacteria group bacterium]
MRILGIESSCDETAISLVVGDESGVRVEKSIIRSQAQMHDVFGGVVPEVAAREHLEVIAALLHELPSTGEGIDAIAVTAGPGLAPALRVGTETAKALAYAWQKPLVPVCHLEGHIYASWLSENANVAFPALALIVSGGHTELVLMRDHGKFERLGETLDDAAGEAFDKVAKMLGLGYPGGPRVAELASSGDRTAFDFPRAMLDRDDFMFSFSGLKTSVLYTLRENDDKLIDPTFRRNIAASFEEAVIDVLVKKTMRAVKKHQPASVILAGGVAANLHLRESLRKACDAIGTTLHVPDFAYSLDNAAMIAAAGYYRFKAGATIDPLKLVVDPNMDIV